MAENNSDAQASAAQQFAIQKIYTKDLSFESPSTPAIFTEQWEPQVNVDLNTNGQALDDKTYEVVLMLTVTAKVKDKTAVGRR